ncbi:MAG: transporter substrate-binding domain-containing protein [Rhodocyclaceae bacterium]|nr:transporter substrate-binding domain-containing protein [Rhodocyclaceae bacterium]
MKLLFALSMSLFCASAFACTIRIVYSDIGSPPHFTGDGETIPENPGIAVELVTLAAAKIDCKIAWQRLPNRRVQKTMEDGDADAMLMFSFNEERRAYAAYPMKNDLPDPALRLAALTYRVYVKDGSALTWDGKQFAHVEGPIGVNAGYSVAKELPRLGVVIDEVPGTLNNLKKLQLGRIAAYVMQEHSADPVIDEANLADIKKLPVPFSTRDYYLPFSKKFYGESSSIVLRLWKQIPLVQKEKGKELVKKYHELN